MDTDHTNAAGLILHPSSQRTRYDRGIRGDGSSPRRIGLSIPGPLSLRVIRLAILLLSLLVLEIVRQRLLGFHVHVSLLRGNVEGFRGEPP